MAAVVRSKLVKIGNSRGVRIPRALLEQVGLNDEIEMQVQGNKLVIHSAHKSRQGWDAQFASMAEVKDDQLLDAPVLLNSFDQGEWEW